MRSTRSDRVVSEITISEEILLNLTLLLMPLTSNKYRISSEALLRVLTAFYYSVSPIGNLHEISPFYRKVIMAKITHWSHRKCYSWFMLRVRRKVIEYPHR